jgi:hypothetical protein
MIVPRLSFTQLRVHATEPRVDAIEPDIDRIESRFQASELCPQCEHLIGEQANIVARRQVFLVASVGRICSTAVLRASRFLICSSSSNVVISRNPEDEDPAECGILPRQCLSESPIRAIENQRT